MATDNPSVDIDVLVKIYKEAVKKGDSHRVDLASYRPQGRPPAPRLH